MSHTLSREIAMKRLYAETVGGSDSLADALEQSLPEASEQSGEDMLPDEDALFSDRLYEGVHAHLQEIDAEIEAHAKDWSLSRIAKVDLSILRVAVYELLYERAIPVGATVNEAVELAKEFGGEKSPGFINGVLGAIAKVH
jgi:N utilization substance protein B